MTETPRDTDPLPATASTPQAEALTALQNIVPGAFRDGELDPDALLAELGIVAIDEDSDKPYSFTWSGITRSRFDATAATTATLTPAPDLSLDWESTGNVLIEGDNLQVLKVLLNGYRSRFKLIYIDPPYNTGSTFTYSDRFAIPEAEWLRLSGQVDDEGNALTARIENGGRKHAPWLTMMLSRLIIARHLLARDGAIVVAIDDNEVHHLRQLMDGVFGEGNLIGSFVWEGGRKNDARFVSVGHDYMLCYARDKAHLVSKDVRWHIRKRGLAEIYVEVDRLRDEHGADYAAIESGLKAWYEGLPKDHPSLDNRHYRKIDVRGIYYPDNLRSPNLRTNLVYDYKGYKPHQNGWAVEQKVMVKLDAEDRLVFPDDPEGRIAVKRYLHEHEDQALSSVFYRDRRASAKALDELMGGEVFDFPKDVNILAQLLEAMTSGNDLVLDFFAGSGTTGHAVWQQNRKDGGSRRFVLVQAAEETEAGGAAHRAGFTTIFELMTERLRRAASRLADGDSLPDEDIGFRVFRASPSNLREDPPIVNNGELDGEAYIQQALAIHGTPAIREDADAAFVLWEVLVKGTRFDLASSIEEREVEGVTVFEVRQRGDDTGARTVVSLADSLSLAQIDGLDLQPTDTLVCIKESMDDGTAVTAGQRCKLMVVERVRSEVSL